MSMKDLLFSGLWANALFIALALVVVGPHTLATMDVHQVVGMISAKPGVATAMLLLSFFGGVALHGRLTARFTKSK